MITRKMHSYILVTIITLYCGTSYAKGDKCENGAIFPGSSGCIPPAAMAHLGYGYSVIDGTYKAGGVLDIPIKGPVIDLEKVHHKKGLQVHKDTKSTNNTKEIFGSSFAEFADNIAASAGLKMAYAGFKASLKAQYSTSASNTQSTKYASVSNVFKGSRWWINADPLYLSKFLHSDFVAALRTYKNDPEDIIKYYGTHIATSSLLGSKYEMRSNSSDNSKTTMSDFKGAVTMSYNGVVASASADASISKKTSNHTENKNITTTISATGGDTSLLGTLTAKSGAELLAWKETIGHAKKQVMLGTGTSGDQRFVPIWDIIALVDKNLSKKVELAFKAKLALQPSIRIFQSVSTTVENGNDRVGTVQVPRLGGYKMLSGGTKVTGVGHNGSRIGLLRESYPSDANTWTSRVTWAQWPNAATGGSVTTYALAIHDPYNIWMIHTQVGAGTSRLDRTNISGNLDKPWYGKLTKSIKAPEGFTLVGGGAKLGLENGVQLPEYGTMKGPFIVSTLPNPHSPNEWVAEFTNMVSVNFGDSSSRSYRGSTSSYGNYSGRDSNNHGGPVPYWRGEMEKLNSYEDWSNWYVTHYDSTMQVYAIGIKLREDINVIVAQGIQVDDSGNKSLHPKKTANTPACMEVVDGETQSQAFMTAGGAYTKEFVHSPFFISSNYPETLSSWTTEMSNDRNYNTNYDQHWQRWAGSSGCDGGGNHCDHGTMQWRSLTGVAGNDSAKVHSVINYLHVYPSSDKEGADNCKTTVVDTSSGGATTGF